ncbi:hypothetical protein ACS0TY_016140 [Phlomoides rotata]
MAARKSHRYLNVDALPSPNDSFEFDEADIWSTKDDAVLPETKKQVRYNPRPTRKSPRKSVDIDRFPMGSKSLPLNIPKWSKIEEDDVDEENDKIPPHEYLARKRGASLSVHEGVGRTLKGRDLRRVRNAIWKQLGFED